MFNVEACLAAPHVSGRNGELQPTRFPTGPTPVKWLAGGGLLRPVDTMSNCGFPLLGIWEPPATS